MVETCSKPTVTTDRRRPRRLAPLAPALRPPVDPDTPVTLALLVARDNARIARELRAARMEVRGSGLAADRTGASSSSAPQQQNVANKRAPLEEDYEKGTGEPLGGSANLTAPASELVAKAATRVLAAIQGVLGQGEGLLMVSTDANQSRSVISPFDK